MWLVYAILWLSSFLAMELVAFLAHKYVMHGFLWRWHQSHHRVHYYLLEKNDLFAVVFAIPSIVCLLLGYFCDLTALIYVGYGIMSYGLFYLLFHDILVHQRLRLPYLPKNGYLRRMVNAHHAHHKRHTKEDCESFGFLIVSKRYANRSSARSKSK